MKYHAVKYLVPVALALAVGAIAYAEDDTAFRLEGGECRTYMLDTLADGFEGEFRAAVTVNRAISNSEWGIEIADATQLPLCRCEITWLDAGQNGTYDSRSLRLTAYLPDLSGGWQEASHADFFKDVDLHRGQNTLVADVSDGVARFAVGSDFVNYGVSAKYQGRPAAVTLSGNCPLKVEYVAIRQEPDPALALTTGWTPEKIEKYLAGLTADGQNSPEGKWGFLDRQNDPKWARQGGFYTLAVIADGNGGFDIIYLDGAQTNRKRWHAGMLKGHLSPTGFQNHYILKWYDAELNDAGMECSADLTDNAILTLNFPLHRAVMRFSRAK